MNYDRLFAFTLFAEHLNFTRAAKALHISQPALHVQIRKLTEEVGRPLYRRAGRALALTPEGKRIAAYGREVEARGRAVLDEVRGVASSGPVVLASGQGAFSYLLGPAIRKFPQRKWPLRLVTMTGPDAIEAVRDARAHLAVLATETPPADLLVTSLCAIGQRVILPRGHRLARKKGLKPADLAGEPLIVAPPGSPHRVMLQQLLRASGRELDVAVEATGWELMLQFARYRLGIAVVNDFCPVPAGMVGLPLKGAPAATYYLVSRGARSEGVEAMRALIRATVRR